MILNFVNKIFKNSGSEIVRNEFDTKLSEEHSVYCATSLTTFYRPERLKIAILDHLPCNIESLSIDLFTTQRSGNFKEYIISNIQGKKKNGVPKQTLVMNGYSFYSIVSSSKKVDCDECGSNLCSSLVIDFTRNSDNGEPTYLIFQGNMILRIYDRKTNLNIYSLATYKTPSDIINITRDNVILSIPDNFMFSESFNINLILYSVVGWTRNVEDIKVKSEKKDDKTYRENYNKPDSLQNYHFSVSSSEKLVICNEDFERGLGELNKGTEGFSDVKTPVNYGKNCHNLKDSSVYEKIQFTGTPNSSSTPISAKLKAKAPPLPMNIKSAPRSKSIYKGPGKGDASNSPQNKKKNLPLGRRIHWKPLSEELAKRTIFREILYTSLGSHARPPITNQTSEIINAEPLAISKSYVGDIFTTNEGDEIMEMSPISNPTSPITISDFHMANTLVHMETLSRIFTKSSTNTINSFLNPQGDKVIPLSKDGNKILSSKSDKFQEHQKRVVDHESLRSENKEIIYQKVSENYTHKSVDLKNDKSFKDEQNSSNITNNQKQFPLTFLSQKRAQNMAIVLARLSVPTEYIIEVLKSFNISNLTLEDYERIEQVLPTELELEKIKKNQKSELHQIEQFLSRFSHISNPMTRLRFLKFEHILDASEFDIQKNLNTLHSASIQMRNSSRLKLILKAFLLLGNYVNHGINFSSIPNDLSSIPNVMNNGSINWSLLETKGFSLSSLLRLIEFKTTIDPSLSALHYIIANLTFTNPKLDLSQLQKDLQAVSDASKISIDALFTCINDMRKELAILEIEKSKFSNERVEYLFESYSRRLDALIEGYHRIVEKVVDTALYFGQTLPEGNKTSIIQPFFETMNTFLLQFSSCCKEIRDKPMKFSPLLVDSSVVFSFGKDSNSFNSHSQTNSTSNSSSNSTPLTNNTPSTSFSKIRQISDNFSSPTFTKCDDINNKRDCNYNSQLKKSSVREHLSLNVANSKKRETGNVILIRTSDKTANSNALRLPNRPPPPKYSNTNTISTSISKK